MVTKIAPLALVRKLALRFYDREAKTGDVSKGLLPAKAKTEVRSALAKAGYSARPIISAVDGVYFAENGTRNPLPASATKGAKALAVALAARRTRGGTLARFDSLYFSARAAYLAAGKTPPTKAEVRTALASKVALDSSYIGLGTRAGAPKTLEGAGEG